MEGGLGQQKSQGELLPARLGILVPVRIDTKAQAPRMGDCSWAGRWPGRPNPPAGTDLRMTAAGPISKGDRACQGQRGESQCHLTKRSLKKIRNLKDDSCIGKKMFRQIKYA